MLNKNESLVNNISQNSNVIESIIDSGNEKNGNFISGKSETNKPTINCSIGKSYIITEDQIRMLYFEFTFCNSNESKLIKVKDNEESWFGFEEAKEFYYYANDDDFKREYDNLRNSCKENEIVIFEYIPFSFQQMLDSVKEKIDIYCQKNKDAGNSGLDAELANLFFLHDIIQQNI